MTNEGNAQIARTHLGLEDHGMLTIFLHLRGDGWGQGFGGYDCRKRTLKTVTDILVVVGVEKWEDLPGKYIRFRRRDDAGWNAPIEAIGHIYEDKWFSFRDEGKTK